MYICATFCFPHNNLSLSLSCELWCVAIAFIWDVHVQQLGMTQLVWSRVWRIYSNIRIYIQTFIHIKNFTHDTTGLICTAVLIWSSSHTLQDELLLLMFGISQQVSSLSIFILNRGMPSNEHNPIEDHPNLAYLFGCPAVHSATKVSTFWIQVPRILASVLRTHANQF